MKRYESLVSVLANCNCLLNLLPKFNLGVKYKPGNQELGDKNFKIIFYTFDVSFISKMKQHLGARIFSEFSKHLIYHVFPLFHFLLYMTPQAAALLHYC